jgi:uncharacterized protein DUF3352
MRAGAFGLVAATLGCVVLLVAGCGGREGTGAGASDLVPATAPLYIAVDTDPDSSQWRTVDDLASRFPDKQKGVDSLKRSLKEEDDLDWERDVKPALGKELDFAWLDLANGAQEFVLLTQPNDEGKFEALIAKANKIDPSNKTVYEKVQGWEVLAEKQSTLDRFRRESESSKTRLSEEAAFRHSMDRLGGDAIVRAYANGGQLMRLVRRSSGPGERPLINRAGTLDWIALKLAATSDGLGLDTIVHGTPGPLFKGLRQAGGGFSAKLPDTVPRNALVYWTFHGTKGMLSGVAQNPLFGTPELRRFSGVLREIGSVLQGENALYVRPSSGSMPEVTFVASPGNGTNGATVLDRLLARYRTDLHVAPQRMTVAGTPTRKLGFGTVAGYYANVGGKLVLTDLPAGIRGVKEPGAPLSHSETYRDARAASGLPSKSQGFLYVDIHSTIPFVERLSKTHLPPVVSRNLKPLHSAMEYAVSHSHEVQVTLFLRIA